MTFSPVLTFPSLRFGIPRFPAPPGLGSMWDVTGPRVLSRPRQKDPPEATQHPWHKMRLFQTVLNPRAPRSPTQLPPRSSSEGFRPSSSHCRHRHFVNTTCCTLVQPSSWKAKTPKDIKKKSRGVKKEKNPQLAPWNWASTWSFTRKSIKLPFEHFAIHRQHFSAKRIISKAQRRAAN